MDYRQRVGDLVNTNFEISKDRIKNDAYADYFKALKGKYKYYCVFGAGSLGNEMINMFKEFGVEVDYVCDNNFESIKNRYTQNPKSIRFDDLCKMKEECLVFVSPSNGLVRANEAINNQLRDAGFNNVVESPIWKNMVYLLREITDMDKDWFLSKVLEMIDWCEDDISRDVILAVLGQLFQDYRTIKIDNKLEDFYDCRQYFVDFVGKREDECFVDGGAFSGDTFESFYKWCNGKYEKYYGFELEENNRKALKETIHRLEKNGEKTEVLDCGLFDKYDRVKIFSQNDASHIAGVHTDFGYDNAKYLEVRPLDECLSGKKVTFIKMDIENSEIPALFGARKTITEQKPLCAISVYHGLRQLVEVPGILKFMNPDYKIWYRIHSTVGHDIVCYAIDKDDKRLLC